MKSQAAQSSVIQFPVKPVAPVQLPDKLDLNEYITGSVEGFSAYYGNDGGGVDIYDIMAFSRGPLGGRFDENIPFKFKGSELQFFAWYMNWVREGYWLSSQYPRLKMSGIIA